MKIERGEIYKWTNGMDSQIWGIYEVLEIDVESGLCQLKVLDGSGNVVERGKTFRYVINAFTQSEWVHLEKSKYKKLEDTASERETLEI